MPCLTENYDIVVVGAGPALAVSGSRCSEEWDLRQLCLL